MRRVERIPFSERSHQSLNLSSVGDRNLLCLTRTVSGRGPSLASRRPISKSARCWLAENPGSFSPLFIMF